VSWYRPHLEISLEMIRRFAPSPHTSIIDVGAGESTLVDDLAALGYQRLAALDISRTAIEANRARLRGTAEQVSWLVGDVLDVRLPAESYDIWHDRAVFHFLVDANLRKKYVRNVLNSLRTGGYAIVSTFGLQGPLKCSELDVMRYDPESLHAEFGRQFRIEESREEVHQTPWGTTQQFVYCCCRVECPQAVSSSATTS
jgi:2-polyprenyl-3-methyl-5-hydroxy-6-metoxy-1,4-benzoquinol methylase